MATLRIKKTFLLAVIFSCFAINSYAFNLNCTLTNKWETQLLGYFYGQGPVIAKNGNIVILTHDNNNGQTLLNLFDTTGNQRLLEILDEKGFDRTLQVDQDGTFYIAKNNKLYAISATGKIKWVFSTEDSNEIRTIAINATMIGIIGPNKNKIYGINKQGKTLWTLEDPNFNFKYITAGNDTFYAVSSSSNGPDEKLYALSNTGQVKWNFFHMTFMTSFKQPAVNKKTNTVYITSDHTLFSFNQLGWINWKLPLRTDEEMNEPDFAPTIDEQDGTIYIDANPASTDRARYAYAIDPIVGWIKWKTPLPDTVDFHRSPQAPIITDKGIIFIGTNNKTKKDQIYVLNKQGKLICPALPLDLNNYSLALSPTGQLYIGKYPNIFYAKSITINGQ